METKIAVTHTPTPWSIEDGEHGSITLSGGHHIADIPYWDEPGKPQDGWSTQGEAIANAAYIVRAVNAHEELLDACKTVVAHFEDVRKRATFKVAEPEYVTKAKQAIAKVESL